MTLSLYLVVIIIAAVLVFTLLLAGKGDDGYQNAAKKNTLNLSFIYIIVILFSLLAVGLYIN